MVKLILRNADKKYLQSVETDTWVDDKKYALEMTYRECEAAKTELFKTYQQDELKEIVNMFKNKPVSEEEQKELLNLLKTNK